MCTLYVLFYLSDTNTPHQKYWLKLPLRIARCPSRANGGAPVPAPVVALPFWRLLTFVRPTPVPPSPTLYVRFIVMCSHSIIVSYCFSGKTGFCALGRWLVTDCKGHTDGLGGTLVGQGWDGPTLASAGMGAPPLTPE